MLKKKIAVFHAGGTTSMVTDADGGVNVRAEHPLLNHALDNFEVDEKVFFGVPSPQMDEAKMTELASSIITKFSSGDFDGVVVTHGTDTMEETAYFLDITVPKHIPIAITGSMRSFDAIGSDSLVNYHCAIRAAASDEAKGMGTMLVFNGSIYAARDVTKIHTANLAGFNSPGAGSIGFISAQNDVVFTRTLPPNTCYEVGGITKNVLLIKAYAGINATIFDALEALAEKQGDYPIDGLVVEAFGAGNLPNWIVPCLQKIESKGIPIILSTRCVDGSVQGVYDYSGGGKALKTREVKSIILSNGLSGVKARLKLAVLLEKTSDLKEIEAEFAR